jgi:hypothetical protein
MQIMTRTGNSTAPQKSPAEAGLFRYSEDAVD